MDGSSDTTTRRELLVFAGGLLAAVVLLLLLGGGVLWTRPFWMDEVAMFFLTGESSPARMIQLIARGADWNPPTLHLIVWTAMRAAGMDRLTPVVLHTFALLVVSLALFVVYLTLRRRFGRTASAAGVLAVAAQNLVVVHAFEGRFYGPWLLFAAAFAWSLDVDREHRSRRRDAVIAALSILLCTIHWYGIFSLALMWAGVLFGWRRRWRDAVRLLAPSLAGVAVLLALAPLALSQRESATPVLWVQALSAAQIKQMTGQFFPAVLVLVVALLVVADSLRPLESQQAARARATAAFGGPDIAALLALVAMPLVLIVLSAAFTPSMVPRYAIVTSLAWAPAIAFAAETFGRLARWTLVGVLVTLVCLTVAAHAGEQRLFASAIAVNAAAFEQAKAYGVPVVFQRLHVIYPVAGTQRGPATPARYIRMSDSTIHALYPHPRAEWVRANLRLDRDQAAYHERLYGWPVLAPVAALDTMPRFLFLATDATLPPGYAPISRYAGMLFPNHRATRLSPELTLLERGTGPAPR